MPDAVRGSPAVSDLPEAARSGALELIASETVPVMLDAAKIVSVAASVALQAMPAAVTAGEQVMPIAAWPPLPRRC